MNEVIVLKAKRQINVAEANEITGDVKRVYSSVPLMLKAKRAVEPFWPYGSFVCC